MLFMIPNYGSIGATRNMTGETLAHAKLMANVNNKGCLSISTETGVFHEVTPLDTKFSWSQKQGTTNDDVCSPFLVG